MPLVHLMVDDSQPRDIIKHFQDFLGSIYYEMPLYADTHYVRSGKISNTFESVSSGSQLTSNFATSAALKSSFARYIASSHFNPSTRKRIFR